MQDTKQLWTSATLRLQQMFRKTGAYGIEYSILIHSTHRSTIVKPWNRKHDIIYYNETNRRPRNTSIYPYTLKNAIR